MNDEQLERLLRDASPSGPPPELRAELLQRATHKVAARRRGEIIRWAFAAAAGLLIAINVAFGHVHERRMEQITGRPTVTLPNNGTVLAAQFNWRNQELLELIGDLGNHWEVQ